MSSAASLGSLGPVPLGNIPRPSLHSWCGLQNPRAPSLLLIPISAPWLSSSHLECSSQTRYLPPSFLFPNFLGLHRRPSPTRSRLPPFPLSCSALPVCSPFTRASPGSTYFSQVFLFNRSAGLNLPQVQVGVCGTCQPGRDSARTC